MANLDDYYANLSVKQMRLLEEKTTPFFTNEHAINRDSNVVNRFSQPAQVLDCDQLTDNNVDGLSNNPLNVSNFNYHSSLTQTGIPLNTED